MGDSLYAKICGIISGMKDRIEMFETNIREYLKEGNYGDAHINQIKMGEFKHILLHLEKALIDTI